MSSLIDDAAQMSLLDAAYFLWRARRQLDARDRPARWGKSGRGARPGSASFISSVEDAIRAARAEPGQAHDGPTFHRLKLAHPEASDKNLQEAIKAAVKLETDCAAYFSHNNSDYAENIKEAVRLARMDNPEFSDATYRSLFDYMAYVMK